MRNIDLTPATARARAARRTSTHRWIAAYGVAILLGAGAMGFARVRTAAMRVELSRVNMQVEQTAEEMNALAEISGELAHIADSLELQAAIVPRPAILDTLDRIMAAIPDSMTLTSLLLDQRRNTNAASIRASRRAGEEDQIQIATNVQIAGVTPDDAEVIRLISDLDRSGIFDEITLEYARPVVVAGRDAREFRIVSTAPSVFPAGARASAEGGK